MKIYAINGSPRKKWNTANVLQSALDGAASAFQAETELINLYELKYKGCISCFQCKLIGGPSYGRCAVKDELKPILDEIIEADAIIFGSPIYFSDVTGMMRCFLERLCFALFVYDQNYSSLAPKKIPTGFIYTMNVPHDMMATYHYPERLGVMEAFVHRIFGHKPLVEYVNNTVQFADYSKYKVEIFSEKDKQEYREKHFAEDCQKASEMARSLLARGN